MKERAHAEERIVTSFLEEALRRQLARAEATIGPVDVYLAPPSGSPDGRPLVDLTDKDAVQAVLDEDDFAIHEVRRGRAQLG